jgi:hypothetical protein
MLIAGVALATAGRVTAAPPAGPCEFRITGSLSAHFGMLDPAGSGNREVQVAATQDRQLKVAGCSPQARPSVRLRDGGGIAALGVNRSLSHSRLPSRQLAYRVWLTLDPTGSSASAQWTLTLRAALAGSQLAQATAGEYVDEFSIEILP